MDPWGSGGAPPPPPPLPLHRPSGASSFGPLIVALAVIAVLGALAVVMGRVCFGRRSLFGYGRYDLEAWVETKCASCVDGTMDQVLHPRPRPRHHLPPPPSPPPPPPPATPPPDADGPPLPKDKEPPETNAHS